MLQDVMDFHVKFGRYRQAAPAIPHREHVDLRFKLLNEEFFELEEAMKEESIVEIADALADLTYIIMGTAITYGIDLRDVWTEVQRSNMAKEGGAIRPDGKVLKPPGWTPPDVSGCLNRQKLLF